MSKRYYLCDVVGDGTEFNPWRPEIANYPVSWSGVINRHQGNALVIVDTKNHGQLLANNRIDAMPDFPLDARMSAMQKNTKDVLDTVLARRGFVNIGVPDGYRDLIRGVGQTLDPNFSENNFDVNAE